MKLFPRCACCARYARSFRLAGSLLACCFAFTSFVSSTARAQTTATVLHGSGIVKGVVSDEHTSEYLEGAEVRVVGSSMRTTTLRAGEFLLRNLPLGEVQIRVSYPGLETQVVSVVVSEDRAVELKVKLKSELVQMTEFKVTTTKEGLAKALALQKSSDSAKTVAASDQFGDIASGDVSSYLKNLPGVAQSGYAVSLRGMSSAFTNVTIDGNSVASATSGEMNRRFEFEQLVIDSIDNVEVTKTATPDRPATNTGGSVNLLTKGAFDRVAQYTHYRVFGSLRDRYISLDRQPGYRSNQLVFPVTPNASLEYVGKLRENLGVYLGVRRYNPSMGITDRSEYVFTYDPAQGGRPEDPLANAWRYHIERGSSSRTGGSVRLDWKASPNTTLTGSVAWTGFDMWFNYHQLGIYVGNPGAVSYGSTPVSSYDAGQSLSTKTGGRVQLAQSERNKSGDTYSTDLKGKHIFPNGARLELSSSWSKATNYYDDMSQGCIGYVYPQKASLWTSISNVGAVIPTYSVKTSAGADYDIDNLANLSIPSFTTEPRKTSEIRQGYTVDYLRDLSLVSVPTALRVGARYDNRWRHNRKDYLRGGGNIPSARMNEFIDPVWSGADLGGLGVPSRNWIDLRKIYEAFSGVNIPAYKSSDNGTFDEDQWGAYARFDVKLTDKLLMVGGARQEWISSDNLNRVAAATGHFRADGLYPSLNFRYTPASDLVLRAAVSQTIGLPDFNDLLPSSFSVTEPSENGRGYVTMSNPNLEPYEVVNYDLGAEYYFSGNNSVSVALFRKRFSNYIINRTMVLTPALAQKVGFDLNALTDPDNYYLRSRVNVTDPGYYNGVEFGYTQSFRMLPPPFNTLNVQINATFLSIDPIESVQVFDASNQNQDRALREQVRRALDLNAAKRRWSATLNWRYRKFDFLVNMNTGSWVDTANIINTVTYAGRAVDYLNETQRLKPRTVIDFRIEWRQSSKFTPFVQLRDILAQPIEYYSNGRRMSYAKTGAPLYEFGFKGWW